MRPYELTPIGSAILSTLAYFSIFKHPLKLTEIVDFCHFEQIDQNEVMEVIQALKVRGIVAGSDGFYFLPGEENIINRRLNGEEVTPFFMKKAQRYSKLIAKFPFVRAVFISGSLSKGYMDKESDIDYFIITRPDRLWICRSLLVFFKKIFLLNSHKYFCVNYFIDSNNLNIADRNIFTATELVFVLPMVNEQLYKDFMQQNNWTRYYYPNLDERSDENILPEKNNFIKSTLEKILLGSFGEKLDTWCFSVTIKFWKKKFSNFDDSVYDMELRSKKNVSKHHPRGFQKVVLDLYTEKINHLEQTHKISFVFPDNAVVERQYLAGFESVNR